MLAAGALVVCGLVIVLRRGLAARGDRIAAATLFFAGAAVVIAARLMA
jgi:hypothetical protein